MSQRPRVTATLAAVALATTALTSQLANTAFADSSVIVDNSTEPVLAAAAALGSANTTSNGVTAALSATNAAGKGLTISLNATASSTSNAGATITNYAFDYGDGQTTATATTATASHTYANPGTYTVTVTVTDSTGASAQTTATLTTTGSDYTPVVLDRILDTRSGLGAPKAKISYGSSIALQVTGVDGIPTGATGVVLNLTAVDTTDNGLIECYPDGTTAPNVSNLNYLSGQTINNMVTIPVGADGKIDCSVTGQTTTSTDLLGDLEGYYAPTNASSYIAIQPGRILDSRSGSGIGSYTGTLASGHSVTLPVAGATATTYINSATGNTTETLPSGNITAVAVNITVVATSGTGTGIITADADDATGGTGTDLNYPTDSENLAEPAIVKVGADGKIKITAGGTSGAASYLLVDVTGYYYNGTTAPTGTTPAVYLPVTETRILDTRKYTNDQLYPGEYYEETNLNTNNGITAYVLNTTVTSTTGNGALVVHPDAAPDNATSNINYTSGVTLPKNTQATAASGGIDFYNNSTAANTQLILDEFGYFTAQ